MIKIEISDILPLTKTLSYLYMYSIRYNEFNIKLYRNDTRQTYRIDQLMTIYDNNNYYDIPKIAPIWVYDYCNKNKHKILQPFDTVLNTCNWIKTYLSSMEGIITSLKNLLKYDYYNALPCLPKSEIYCYIYTSIERDDDSL